MVQPDRTQLVPDCWQVDADCAHDEAAPIRWRSTPLTLLALLVVPRRMSWRVACATWPQTVAVLLIVLALIGVFAGTVVILLSGRGLLSAWFSGKVPTYNWVAIQLGNDDHDENTVLAGRLTYSERVRLPFAAFIGDLYAGTDGVFSTATTVVPAIALVIACFGTALVFMPAVARTLPPGRRFGRSVKLCVWASICAVPAMFAAILIAGLGENWLAEWRRLTYAECFALVAVVSLLWWTALVIKLGRHSTAASQHDNPCRIRPACFHCGYTISGLPVTGRCPECGSGIAQFLPENRLIPPWVERSRTGRVRAWGQTVFAVIVRRDFLGRIAIHRGVSDALRFAAISSFTAALPCIVIAILAILKPGGDREAAVRIAVDLLLLGGSAALLIYWAMLFAVVIASRACRQSPNALLIVGCYATSLVFPMVALIITAFSVPWIGVRWDHLAGRGTGVEISTLSIGSVIRAVSPTVFIWSMLILTALALAVRRTWRSMRAVRFSGW